MARYKSRYASDTNAEKVWLCKSWKSQRLSQKQKDTEDAMPISQIRRYPKTKSFNKYNIYKTLNPH